MNCGVVEIEGYREIYNTWIGTMQSRGAKDGAEMKIELQN